MPRFKLSKAKMADYLENKKIVNEHFKSVKWGLLEKLEKLPIYPNLNIEEAATGTLYINGLRFSDHRKKLHNPGDGNGFMITMRNVKNSTVEKDTNK